MTNEETEQLHRIAMENSEIALIALQNGDYEKFHKLSAEAFLYEKKAALSLYDKQTDINISFVFQYLETQLNIDSQRHVILDEKYEPWIFNEKGIIDKRYWNRYVNFLLQEEKWAPDTIDKLDNITDDILDHLKN